MSDQHNYRTVDFSGATFHTQKDGTTVIFLKEGEVYETPIIEGSALVMDGQMMRVSVTMLVIGPYASLDEVRRRRRMKSARWRRMRDKYK